jgi:hypothetical protein
MKSENSNATLARLSYGLTIFLGAFLMFQIQPLVGKVVTAQFGGVAAIWCVCLMFFQIALLAGYLLTFAITKLPVKQQCVVYCLLMAASVALLNVPPASGWSAPTNMHPVENLLILLTVHLAVPCTLLATISGLMQSFYENQKLGDPYPLYGLSNIGSMTALLLYPIVVEPLLGVDKALSVWNAGYVLLACSAVLSTFLMFRKGTTPANTADVLEDERQPAPAAYGWWVGLSALATIILIVYTTYITQDIAPVPFLWILPLCVYLLAFIICFGKKNAYYRGFYLYVGPIFWLLDPFARHVKALNVLCVLAMIFCFCMVCCGEIVLRKPAPRYLPSFYLAIAFGGVLGGMAVNLLAPITLDFYAEKYALVFVMLGLCLYANAKDGVVLIPNKIMNTLYVCVLAYSIMLLDGYLVFSLTNNVIARMRNFYGCLSVIEVDDGTVLASGTIVHGSQYKDPARRREPSQYFARETGLNYVDKLLRRDAAGQPMHYGVVGLGAGTIAVYGQKGDSMRFYEIDPKVETVARRYFTFLSDSPANVDVVIADGRKALEADKDARYNLLIIDAFNGDAVPVHMLTREAIALYMQRLKPGGICLMHISNRYLNLAPAIANVAHSLGYAACSLDTDNSRYVAVSREPLKRLGENGSLFARLVITPIPEEKEVGVWTDDYSNLFASMVSNLKHGSH